MKKNKLVGVIKSLLLLVSIIALNYCSSSSSITLTENRKKIDSIMTKEICTEKVSEYFNDIFNKYEKDEFESTAEFDRRTKLDKPLLFTFCIRLDHPYNKYDADDKEWQLKSPINKEYKSSQWTDLSKNYIKVFSEPSNDIWCRSYPYCNNNYIICEKERNVYYYDYSSKSTLSDDFIKIKMEPEQAKKEKDCFEMKILFKLDNYANHKKDSDLLHAIPGLETYLFLYILEGEIESIMIYNKCSNEKYGTYYRVN